MAVRLFIHLANEYRESIGASRCDFSVGIWSYGLHSKAFHRLRESPVRKVE
jgi:hypothetical protein